MDMWPISVVSAPSSPDYRGSPIQALPGAFDEFSRSEERASSTLVGARFQDGMSMIFPLVFALSKPFLYCTRGDLCDQQHIAKIMVYHFQY